MDPYNARILTDRPLAERLDLAYVWIKETKAEGVCSMCSHSIRASSVRAHIFKHLSIKKPSLHSEPLTLMRSADLETLLEGAAEAAPSAPSPVPVSRPVALKALRRQSSTPPSARVPELDRLTLLHYIQCREWSTLSLQTGRCIVCDRAVTTSTSLVHMLTHVKMTPEQFRLCHTRGPADATFKTVELPVTVVGRLSEAAAGAGLVTFAAALEALEQPVPHVAIGAPASE